MIDDIYQLFFANSPRMNRIKQVIDQIAKTDVSVLVRGESGTGKGLVSHAIHLQSNRCDQPFIKVNCAAIPKGLLESELFGFEKGAFTGAYQKKPGKFELANGGTILLNEVGEMDISIQAKLLQVLQDGQFARLGGEHDIQVDTRIITTTKDHLEKSIGHGRFREDLFFRISVVSITIPPLRERGEQISHFAQYFFDVYRKKYGRPISSLSQETIKAFKEYHWPGNIREMENIIKRIVLFNDSKSVIESLLYNQGKEMGSSLSEGSPGSPGAGIEVLNLHEIGKKAAELAEKEVIAKTLQETHWNRKKAAKWLRVSYKALLYKIQKYHLDELKGYAELVREEDESFGG